MTLDEYLKTYPRHRGKTGMSEEDFGKKVGMSQSQVNRLRRGENKPPLTTIKAIAAATGGAVTVYDWLTHT